MAQNHFMFSFLYILRITIMKQKQTLRRKNSKKYPHARKPISKKISHQFDDQSNHRLDRLFNQIEEESITKMQTKILLNSAGYGESQINDILKKIEKQMENFERVEKIPVDQIYKKCIKISPCKDLGNQAFNQFSQTEKDFVTLEDLQRINSRLERFHKNVKISTAELKDILNEGSRSKQGKINRVEFEEMFKKSEMFI